MDIAPLDPKWKKVQYIKNESQHNWEQSMYWIGTSPNNDVKRRMFNF